LDQEPARVQEECFTTCFNYFLNAAYKGVSNAHFYLGMIYYEGHFVDHNAEMALDHYIRGAAKNNAFCYFELSRIYSEGRL
jgi:TPR repeat protein